MRHKAIVLDFDGTIYDSFSNGLKSAKDVFRKSGRPFRKHDEMLIREMWGDSLLRIVAALFPEESPTKHRKLLKLWLDCSQERERKTPSRLIPGTNATLKTLKEMGLTIVIATNHSAEKLYEVLPTVKLNLAYIDYLLAHNPSRSFTKFLATRKAKPVIEGTPYKKPDRRYLAPLNRFLNKNGVAPHETIFCGDSLFDAETAAAGGYNFIPVLTGPTGRTTGWWELKLAERRIAHLAIASSVRDLPFIIESINRIAPGAD